VNYEKKQKGVLFMKHPVYYYWACLLYFCSRNFVVLRINIWTTSTSIWSSYRM